jgi:hypothetical protein
MAAAVVHLDRLDLDRASADLAQSDLQNRRRTSSVAYFDLQRALNARLASLVDGPAEALAILREPAASAHEPAVLVHMNRALEARMLIGAGRLSMAHTLLASAGADDLTSARIDLALAEGDIAGTRHHLNTWNPTTTTSAPLSVTSCARASLPMPRAARVRRPTRSERQ